MENFINDKNIYISMKIKILKKINKIWEKIKKYSKILLIILKSYSDIVYYIILYGIMIELILFAFGLPFSLRRMIGLGLGFYFLKEEFPILISKLRKGGNK